MTDRTQLEREISIRKKMFELAFNHLVNKKQPWVDVRGIADPNIYYNQAAEMVDHAKP